MSAASILAVRVYHVSPRSNRESILRDGLLPDSSTIWTRDAKLPEGVYVFPNLDHARRYPPHAWLALGRVPLDVWAIDTDDLTLAPDPLMTAYERIVERVGPDRLALVETITP